RKRLGALEKRRSHGPRGFQAARGNRRVAGLESDSWSRADLVLHGSHRRHRGHGRNRPGNAGEAALRTISGGRRRTAAALGHRDQRHPSSRRHQGRASTAWSRPVLMGYVIGLTGGIGSGKSAAARMFEELGAAIVDTDQIAHELTRPGGAAMSAIRDRFGPEYIAGDGGLERTRMRRLVF